MSNNDALIAKALSTSSEDEAIACLRMARKKGVKLNVSEVSSDYKGYDAKYWYDKAVLYYNKVKGISSSYSIEQFNSIYNMYYAEVKSNKKYKVRVRLLEKEISDLKVKKKTTNFLSFVIGFSVAIILLLPFFT